MFCRHCGNELVEGSKFCPECGGAQDGRCEIQPEVRPCGWCLIYERLKALGRLDLLRQAPVQIMDYSRAFPSVALRQSSVWSLEQSRGEK